MPGKYLFDLVTLPGDVRLAWRRGGWAGVGRELQVRTLYRLYRRHRLLLIEQTLDGPDVPPPGGIDIRPLREDERDALIALMGRRRTRNPRMTAPGRVLLVAWREGRPVGYSGYSDVMERAVEGYELPLPEDGAYLSDLYVLPEARGGGLGSALASARIELARARGKRRAWRLVDPKNLPALGTVRNTGTSGTRVLGELRYLKVLRWPRPTWHSYDPPRPLSRL